MVIADLIFLIWSIVWLFFPYLWTFGLTCSKTKERSTMLDSVSRFVFFIPVVSNKSWHIIQGQRIDSPDRKKWWLLPALYEYTILLEMGFFTTHITYFLCVTSVLNNNDPFSTFDCIKYNTEFSFTCCFFYY